MATLHENPKDSPKDNPKENRLSTSALAKRLKLPMQQLFVTLRDYAWIERQGETWALTGKGELHGGAYQNSQRYGRYIVWPESLIEHPLLSAIESDQRITPGGMRRYYGHLSVLQVSRALIELGLLRSTRQGLTPTALGERFGGRQEHDEEHALSVVTWPHEIVDNPVIHRELQRLRDGDIRSQPEVASEPLDEPIRAANVSHDAIQDLFGDADQENRVDARPLASEASTRVALDGHRVASILQLRVCDWLYEAQLAHAHNRALPTEETLSVDFYVPSLALYIECWERDVPTGELTRRLRTREACRELGLAYQEVAAADGERIDTVLTARALELGHVF